jgi:hypothetical protein
MFYLYVKQPFVEFFSPLQTAKVAYFQRKIQLSGFSAYPDSSPSQLIRIVVVATVFLRVTEDRFRKQQ